jgi:hypothetical protein
MLKLRLFQTIEFFTINNYVNVLNIEFKVSVCIFVNNTYKHVLNSWLDVLEHIVVFNDWWVCAGLCAHAHVRCRSCATTRVNIRVRTRVLARVCAMNKSHE